MRMRWFLDYLAAFQMLLLNGNIGDFKAIFRARKAFKKWLPEFKDDRAEIQRRRIIGRVVERRPYSILWQYYVRGRRQFCELV